MMSNRTKFPRLIRKIFSYWLTPAGNTFKILADDTFLVSYPRSGNTWLRFLLGELISGQEIDFNNMENFIPDIYFSSKAGINRIIRPRYIKSHEPYDARYPKVVYLIRDPRDVAISYYYWLKKFRCFDTSFSKFVENFIHNRTPYKGWSNHINTWYQHRMNVPNGVIFIRYEELLSKPLFTLQKILSFLRISIGPSVIESVISHNTFNQMQEKETRNQDAPIFYNTRQDIAFIRKGQKEQWRQVLSKEQRQLFVSAFAEIASVFGYNLDE